MTLILLKLCLHYILYCYQVELQYLHDYAGVSTSIGLKPSPITHFSRVIGNETFYVGGEVSFDTTSGKFLKYDVGLSFSKPDFVSSLTLQYLSLVIPQI